jgi:putative spermidine/putrescine transport system substrate-binding protein
MEEAMLKRVLVLAAIVGLCGACTPRKSSDASSSDLPYKGQTLTISFWGYNMDLLEKNYIKPFEQKHGVTIVSETGNNSDRYTKLSARKDNPIVDVAFFAGNYAYNAMIDGLIEPYDPSKLTNLSKIIPAAVDPLGGRYAVGYAISHLGIFYRTDKTAAITSWKDLTRPELKGFVSLPGITTTFGPGIIYMLGKAHGAGYSDTEAGWKAMEALVPQLKTVYGNSAELNSLITQEEVYTAPYTSFSWGDIEKMGFPVKSTVPVEGLPASFSVMSVVKGAKNKELAHLFIDYLLSYDVQYAEAMDLVDSPVNVDVKLPPEVGSKLTYGDDLIKGLFFQDEAEVAKNKADWLARWNKLFAK